MVHRNFWNSGLMSPKAIEEKGAKIIFSYNWTIPRRELSVPLHRSWITKKGRRLDGNKNILMLNDIKWYFRDFDSKWYVIFYSFYSTFFPTILLYFPHHLIISDSFFHCSAHKRRVKTSQNQGIDEFLNGLLLNTLYGSKSESQVLWEAKIFLFDLLGLEILFSEIPKTWLF